MAQLFKEYDKKYASFRGRRIFTWEWGDLKAEMNQWPNGEWFAGMSKPSHATIHDAVYKAAGFEEWQKFRVSLKGCSTPLKLQRLYWYWQNRYGVYDSDILAIRVWNYLDALKRGGLIDRDLKVIK